MKKNIIKILFRVLMIAECMYGLYLNLFAGKGGFMNAGALRFYTLQSNILVLAVALISLGVTISEMVTGKPLTKAWYPCLRSATAAAIMLTFGVFWLMLTGAGNAAYLKSAGNLTVHAITPILFVIDFLIFDRMTRLAVWTPFLSVIAPYLYLLYCLLTAKFMNPTPRYPYWFLDLDAIGWLGNGQGLGVLHWILILSVLLTSLSFLFRVIYNRGLAKK